MKKLENKEQMTKYLRLQELHDNNADASNPIKI